MHVLTLPSWFASPRHPTLGSFFKDQVTGMARLGVQSGVIYPRPVPLKHVSDFRKAMDVLEPDTGFPILTECYVTVPLAREYNTRKRLRYFEKLYERYTKRFGKPDVLHAHSCALGPGGSAGLAAQQLSLKHHIPYVITEHASAFETTVHTSAERNRILAAFDGANALIAVSDTLKLSLCEFGVRRPVHVIGNVIDTEVFTPRTSEPAEDEPYRFITIAYLRAIKRLDLVIQAFARTCEVVPDTELIIVGGGTERASLNGLCVSLGIQDRVVFTGELPKHKVAQRLQNSDCYLLSSEHETFSVATHEALACGLEVIASNCGGPVPVLRHYNQTVLDTFTTESLATEMVSKAQHPGQTCRRAQWQGIHDTLSEKRVCEQVADVLRSVVEGKHD